MDTKIDQKDYIKKLFFHVRVKFLKENQYHNLAFRYMNIEDQSSGYDIFVDDKKRNFKIDLTTTNDLINKKYSKGEKIIFKVHSEKPIDFKNHKRGLEVLLYNKRNELVNLGDYFNFRWLDEKSTDVIGYFEITSNKENQLLTELDICVRSIKNEAVCSNYKRIMLFDKPNDEYNFKISSESNLDQPIKKDESVDFNIVSDKEIDWDNQQEGIRISLTDNKEKIVDLNDYFNFQWIEKKANSKIAKFKITSKKENYKPKSLIIKILKVGNEDICSNPIGILLHDQDSDKLTINLTPLSDLNKNYAKDEIIEFNLSSSKDIDWKNETSGVKLILKNKIAQEINVNDYFAFAWDEDSISSQTAKFTLKCKENSDILTSVYLSVVKKDDQKITTGTSKINLYDWDGLALYIVANSDLSKPIREGDEIEFILNSTIDFKWKDKVNGIELFLTNEGNKKVQIEDYFDFAWDDSSITAKTAKFKLTSNKKQDKLTNLNLKVVRINDRSIFTESQTIILADEKSPSLKINLSSDYDFDQQLNEGQSIIFKLESNEDIDWKDSEHGVKVLLFNESDYELDINDYFETSWIQKEITSQTAQFKITSKVEHKELISVNLKVVKIDDERVETTSKKIKLYDEKTILDLETKNKLDDEIKPNDIIHFVLTSSTFINWEDPIYGVKLILKDLNNNEINLNDYFEFLWISSNIREKKSECILKRNEKELELPAVKLVAIKANDQSVSSQTIVLKMFNDKKESEINNVAIISSSSSAAFVMIAIISGLTIYFNRKRK